MMRGKRFGARLVAVAGLAAALAACEDDSTGFVFEPQGRRVYAVDTGGNLLLFGSQNPGTVRAVEVTGLASGEVLVGIDFRPQTGQLFGVGNSNRIYAVDTLTAVATAVGSTAFAPALSGSSFGFDFNPVVDRLRLHGSTGQNLRLHPDLGIVVANDTALTYVAGDVAAGTTPEIVATAYTNSVGGATSTVLFGIDSNRDALVRVEAPNGGRSRTVGALGVNTSTFAGFDIVGADPAGEALAALTVGGGPELYSINLTTGAATRLARINHRLPILGIAVLQ